MKLREAAILVLVVIFSWLNLALLVGASASFAQNFSFFGALGVAAAFLLSSPSKFFYDNMENLEEVVTAIVEDQKLQLGLTVLLFAISSFSFSRGYSIPLMDVLNLSFQASSRFFFPVSNFYTGYLGMEFAGLIFDYSRYYLHFTWIYLISGLAVDGYQKLRSMLAPEDSLNASTIPFTGSSEGDVRAEVYVLTGMHSLFRIPESFCKECNLFVQAVETTAEEVDAEVNIQVKSYWTLFLRPLLKGGYHSPVLLIDGELFSQGYDVPEREELVEIFEELQDG